MFGSIFIADNNEAALGLITQEQRVSKVCFYRHNNMLSVVTQDKEETFMTHEIDPAISTPLMGNSVIHIGHLNAKQGIDDEYTVDLVLID